MARDKKESKNRNNSVKENMKLWNLMKTGTVNYVLRAKICMQHDSEVMRDPILYWVNPATHYRTGDKYKIYPTDLFVVPLIDNVEEITHLCVNKKFSEQLQLYYWLLDVFKMKKPNVMMYSNVDFDYGITIYQKNFVDEKYVENYDDPRLLTLNSLIRRGFGVGALLSIMQEYFIKNKTVILWHDLIAINRKFINRDNIPKYNVIERTNAKILVLKDQYFINDTVTEKEVVQLDMIGPVLITLITDKIVYGEIVATPGQKILKYVPVNNCVELTVEKYDDLLKTRELTFKNGKIDPDCINKDSKTQKFYYGHDMSKCQIGQLVDIGSCVCRVDSVNGSKLNLIMINL